MKPSTSNETVIFLHIPKTAGTTVNRILMRNYLDEETYNTSGVGVSFMRMVEEFRAADEAERGRFRLIKGHMLFGAHEYVPRRSTYFTFLRDPIDRTLSDYYFMQRAASHPIGKIVQEQEMDVRAWIESGIDATPHNVMTRFLSGCCPDFPPGHCTEENLAIAKENLKNYFTVVGITEEFDASLVLLRRAFHWRWPIYRRRNVNPERPAKESETPQTIELLRQANYLDMELYDYGRQLFADRVIQSGKAFQRQLRQFRFINRYLAPFYFGYWEFRKISVRQFIRQRFM